MSARIAQLTNSLTGIAAPLGGSKSGSENTGTGAAGLDQAPVAQPQEFDNLLQVHKNLLADLEEEEEEEMTQLSDPPKYKGESTQDDLGWWVVYVEAWWYSSSAVHTATLNQQLWEVLFYKAFPFHSPAREWFREEKGNIEDKAASQPDNRNALIEWLTKSLTAKFEDNASVSSSRFQHLAREAKTTDDKAANKPVQAVSKQAPELASILKGELMHTGPKLANMIRLAKEDGKYQAMESTQTHAGSSRRDASPGRQQHLLCPLPDHDNHSAAECRKLQKLINHERQRQGGRPNAFQAHATDAPYKALVERIDGLSRQMAVLLASTSRNAKAQGKPKKGTGVAAQSMVTYRVCQVPARKSSSRSHS
eukprot:1143946-Pelagomonas_calceolata.AAC.2